MGSFAVQIAKAVGARVLATAGTRNQAVLRELGVDVSIDYTQQDAAEVALRETGGTGVDAVFDTVGGEAIKKSIPATRPFGRLSTILTPEGTLGGLSSKNQTLYGIFLMRESLRLREMAALIDQGKMRTLIGETLPLAGAQGARAAGLRARHGQGDPSRGGGLTRRCRSPSMRIPAPLLAACLALAAASGCVPLHPVNPTMTVDPCPEIVEFSGFRWHVSTGRMQGDACWSRCQVEVRDRALVLQLSRAAGEPFLGAQLVLAAADGEAHLGFGRYEFRIDPVPAASLPPRSVFAMFSYAGPSGIDRRGVWGYNEIDIEINRSWLQTNDGIEIGTPPVYTVWPAAPSGRRRTGRRAPATHHVSGRTLPDPLASPTLHTFDWAPGSVHFASRHADDDAPFAAWTAIGKDLAPGAIPSAPMVPMINLWAVASGARIEAQECGLAYPCGTWTVIVRAIQLPVPIHKHAGDGQQGAPGERLPDPLIVRVADEQDRPMSGVAVEFSIRSGGGVLSPNAAVDSGPQATAITDDHGLARASWVLGPAGTQAVQAWVAHGTKPAVSFDAHLLGPS